LTTQQRVAQGALALGIPLLLGWIGLGLLRPELASAVGPLLGPWAGVAYGHGECSMASVKPLASAVVTAFGLVAGAGLFLARRRGPQTLALLVAAVWGLAWVGMAGYSVANTLS